MTSSERIRGTMSAQGWSAGLFARAMSDFCGFYVPETTIRNWLSGAEPRPAYAAHLNKFIESTEQGGKTHGTETPERPDNGHSQ